MSDKLDDLIEQQRITNRLLAFAIRKLWSSVSQQQLIECLEGFDPAEIAGVLGVYLSIPVMASLRIVWRRWRMYAKKRRFGPLNEYSFLAETTPRK